MTDMNECVECGKPTVPGDHCFIMANGAVVHSECAPQTRLAAEVIVFPGITTLDISPERVLTAAVAHDLESVVIVGKRKDGTPYYAGSTSDKPAILYMIELFRRDVVLGG